jgi:hypothetical protein
MGLVLMISFEFLGFKLQASSFKLYCLYLIGFRLQASSFKLVGATLGLAACSLQLVAANSRIASFQLTTERN